MTKITLKKGGFRFPFERSILSHIHGYSSTHSSYGEIQPVTSSQHLAASKETNEQTNKQTQPTTAYGIVGIHLKFNTMATRKLSVWDTHPFLFLYAL